MSSDSVEPIHPTIVEIPPIMTTVPKETNDDALDPWHEEDTPDGEKASIKINPHQLQTPDPSILDESIVGGLNGGESELRPDVEPRPMTEILGEFDPLAHREEVEAREAWENSETHPPPPRTPSPTPPPIDKDLSPESPPSTAASSSGFSSLAAFSSFTRNFTIPSLPRPRPLSLDMAKAVTSPATLSSLASQLHTPGRRSPVDTGGSTPTDGGNESSRASGSRDQTRDRGEQSFDFQKFLDQMKLKGAEPIAKYLRSCVWARVYNASY
jgi:hypothetical protein